MGVVQMRAFPVEPLAAMLLFESAFGNADMRLRSHLPALQWIHTPLPYQHTHFPVGEALL